MSRRGSAAFAPLVPRPAGMMPAPSRYYTGMKTSRTTRVALLAFALLVTVGGVLAISPSASLRQRVERWLAPAAVEMKERYEPRPDGPRFDHAAWTAVLERFVDDRGLVDYASLAEDPSGLDAYIEQLAEADFASLGRDEKLALLINAYNAFTLRLILDHYPLESIRDVPSDQRWKGRTWRIGSHAWTLHEIEHEVIRPRFVAPQIHFALNCAAWSCPPLPREAFTGDYLDAQLQRQTERCHRDPRMLRLHERDRRVELTRLYLWYRGDFTQVADAPLAFAARHRDTLRRMFADHGQDAIDVGYLRYDWSLNEQPDTPTE